ncbi:YggS family pyridoxal phosphate-dependent enzyme [Pullulanibacillus sp. KACC 23026]|uniref:YggS family pyridoxal phosphate-dependent enzyme n=1 Tax=Pullulanibacillus sp. KACC 23026 TaxID=3028315 RepID=UPI0023AF2283|nr:YggS family pyridoxal phosphate-dependent enzyme [Pullulanibacillus sp. KACC 23026]WEG15004.1 YggS family pyridoxal phosphate-dependent enzyme [Pullulanibacillus sp. KACC 23026]
MNLPERYQTILNRIESSCQQAGRQLEEVHLVAVTKYVSVETAKAAIENGIQHIGENRAEGLLEKQQAIGRNAVTWHFIGSLQTRKVKEVISTIDYLHSLDRLSLAKEIDKRADKPLNCFVQVNVSGEASKHGMLPEETIPFVKELSAFSKIRVVGLMTMAPLIEDPEELRAIFRRLKHLKEEVASLNLPYAPCTELSMGMSNDFEVAIEEGATYIRIGTALVGKEW